MTYKEIMKITGFSTSTAVRRLAEIRRKKNLKRSDDVTVNHFCEVYGYDVDTVIKVLT